MVGTLTVFDQLEYMKGVDLGFEKEQVMVSVMSRELQGKKDVFKERLLRHPGISDVSFSCRVPGESHWSWGVEIGGVADQIYVNSIEPGYLELMGLELQAGRALSAERMSDQKTKFLVNEAAVRFFNLTSPIGAAVLDTPNGKGEIVGVVKDFHFESLHHRISPLLFYWEDRALRRVSMKIAAKNISEAVDYVKKTWMELVPAFPFEFSFLDEAFDRQYRAEERLTKIFGYFAGLAVVIASLGLFGLSSFMTLRRTKEIGVRKVFGATVPGIVGLLSSQYLRWVLLANLIAFPAAYVGLRYWLEGFAYRTEMTMWNFLLAALMALAVAFGTVVFQSTRAARANPVDALRYE
jgi:putative ABC transport system permease protein